MNVSFNADEEEEDEEEKKEKEGEEEEGEEEEEEEGEWRRRKRKRNGYGNGANISAVSGDAIHPRYAEQTLQFWVNFLLSKLPPGFAKDRCLGCLQPGHSWDGTFSSCSGNCPFCSMEFFTEDGHTASDCTRIPHNAAATLVALASASLR